MSTALASAIVADQEDIWRGPCRIVISDTASPPASFPGKLEDVIDLGTMALESGWLDLGLTSDDGAEIVPEMDVDEGFAVDQKDYLLRGGRVSGVRRSITTTLMDTSIQSIKRLWEAGTLTSIAASVGVNVAQKKLALGNPGALTSRYVAVLQQNDTAAGKLRMFVFRAGKFAETGGLRISAKDPTGVDVTIVCDPDPSQTDGSDFGWLFEED